MLQYLQSKYLSDTYEAGYIRLKQGVLLKNQIHRHALHLRRVHHGDLLVYENTRVMPRAWLAQSWAVWPDREEAARLLAHGQVDFRQTALLEKEPDLAGAGGPGHGGVEILERRADRVRLAKTGSAPGIVVLGEAWYPGWEVRVDGDPAELLRADVMFRGVAVSGGDHEIEFRYRPTSGRLALGLFLAGVATWIGLLAFGWCGRSRIPQP